MIGLVDSPAAFDPEMLEMLSGAFDEAWDAMMDVNLRAVFHLMQLATPQLIKTKGNIVNVSSVTGLRSFPGVLAYCVSKAGVIALIAMQSSASFR